MNPSPLVSVLILNWNGKRDTSECLDSLAGWKKGEIIVVDNGSTDGSEEYFKEKYPSVRVIQSGANLGYAGGNNVGIRAALEGGADYVLLLNNDTKVDSTLVDTLVEGFSLKPDAGILGAKILLMAEPSRLDHFGGIWDKARGDFSYIGWRELDQEQAYPPFIPLDYACGACIMVKREVFEQVGLLEERFFLYFEETDFCFRARRAGYAIYAYPKAKVLHKVSASFTGGKPHSTYFFWRNRFLWMERNIALPLRSYYFLRLFGLALPALWVLTTLRLIQLGLKRTFLPHVDQKRGKERLAKYRACLMGMHDYLLRRFGKGRSDLFLK